MILSSVLNKLNRLSNTLKHSILIEKENALEIS